MPIDAVELLFFGSRQPVVLPVGGLSNERIHRITSRWVATIRTPPSASKHEDHGLLVEHRHQQSNPPQPALPTRAQLIHPKHIPTDDGDILVFPAGRVMVRPGNNDVVAIVHTADDDGTLPPPALMDIGVTLALGKRSTVSVHAMAFERSGLCVIGVGDSGSGKSTVAAIAMASGARVVSDDMILARIQGDSCQVAPLRSFLVIRSPSDRLLPADLGEHLVRFAVPSGAAWSLARETCTGSFVDEAAPNRIWSLSVDRRLKHSRIQLIEAGACLATLIAATSLLILSPRYPEERESLMGVLTRLAETCPAYRVRLGRDVMEDPKGAFDRLLKASS